MVIHKIVDEEVYAEAFTSIENSLLDKGFSRIECIGILESVKQQILDEILYGIQGEDQ